MFKIPLVAALLTFCQVHGKDTATLKKLLAQDVSTNPGTYGFPNNCTFTFPPGSPPGTPPPGVTPVCDCVLANMTTGFPPLGSSQVKSFNQNMAAGVSAANVTLPNSRNGNIQAAEFCNCETSVHQKQRTQVKNNSFTFGGRIDVIEAASEASSSNSSSASSGYAASQKTTVVNNHANGTAVSLPPMCMTVCANSTQPRVY